MRLKYWLAALMLTTTAPAFAQLDWIFAFDDGDGNAQRTNALAITTNPQKYQTVWETQLTPSQDDMYSLEYSLLIADNRIITSIAYQNMNDQAKSTDINAMDADTGKTLWTVHNKGFQTNSLTYNAGKIITLLDGATDDKSTLAAYDIKSGQNIYSVEVAGDIAHLLSYGDNIYFSQNHHAIGSIDPNYGRINWAQSLDAGKFFQSSLSTNGNNLVTREFDNIRIYDIKTGAEQKKIWLPDSRGAGASLYAAPLVDNDTAYGIFQSKDSMWDGTLYAFDLKKQKVKWSVSNVYNEYANVIERSMILTNNTLIALAFPAHQYDADKINFIDAKSGKIMWSWLIPGAEKTSSPYPMVATADTLFIAGKSHVYAISLTTKQVVWTSDKQAFRLYLGAGKLFMEWNDDKNATHLTAVALN